MSISITRRQFALGAAAVCAEVLTSKKGFGWPAASQSVTIHINTEIGTIRPEFHGHFAEHLGSCTYGGLWVGTDSRIPNINGYRKQAVEYLREVGIPVLRWPGGCFADDYHWRDGIGPVAKRPRRVNIHWGNYTEDNSFGTAEFIGLCRLIGAEPYLAGNVGSGTPQELRNWVEYCNFPAGSTLADERAVNGSPEPYRVRYWGVGNENWGCGGNMRSEEYAGLYRQFATYLRNYADTKLFLIACGPNRNDLDWTRRFFDTMRGRYGQVHGYAMHFYSNGKTPATQFTVEALQDQLSSFAKLEAGIVEQRTLLDKYDPQRKIGLMIDEWGVWDRITREDEQRYGKLWQQITMRSAVAAALGLNVFHRQAEKLVMCNIAQIVNVLHSLLLTDGDRCIRTTTYHVFNMMKSHRGQKALRVEVGDSSPLGLSVSASRQGNELVATFVNPRHDQAMKVDCALLGSTAGSAEARVLHDADFNACNTFDAPDRIKPQGHAVSVNGSRLQMELPALSVATVRVRMT